MYGGACDCEATCVYSDKGPWADVENKINFCGEIVNPHFFKIELPVSLFCSVKSCMID